MITETLRQNIDCLLARGATVAAESVVADSDFLQGYLRGCATTYFLAATWLLEDLGAHDEAAALRWFSTDPIEAPVCAVSGEPVDACEHMATDEVRP